MYIENKEIGFIKDHTKSFGLFGFELTPNLELEEILTNMTEETLCKMGYNNIQVETSYYLYDEYSNNFSTILIEFKIENKEMFIGLSSMYQYEKDTIIFKDNQYKIFTFFEISSYSAYGKEKEIIQKLISDYSL